MGLGNKLNRVKESAGAVEDFLIDAVIGVMPWLTPLPSAVLIARATVKLLAWDPWLGVIMAVIVESLGIASINVALRLWEYNRTRHKSNEPAPVKLAIAAVVVYLASIILLTVLFDVIPDAKHLAVLLLPVLTLTAAMVVALRRSHWHRLAAINMEREDRKAARQEARQMRRQIVTDPLDPDRQTIVSNNGLSDADQARLQAGREAKRKARRRQLLDMIKQNPSLTNVEYGRRLDVSRQTITQDFKDLEAEGLYRKNGKK